MCPHCARPLIGSASKGRLGKYYPAYHCDKKGHYFRVRKQDFDDAITKFATNIKLAPGYSDALVSAVVGEWEKREKELHKDEENIDTRIAAVTTQIKMTVDKIKILTSEVAIKYLEADLVKFEQQIADLKVEKEKAIVDKPTDMRIVMTYIKYFLDNMHYLLLEHEDPIIRANAFSVLFDEAPTYEEIKDGTHDLSSCIKLNDVFVVNKDKLAGVP
jgi:hypothetical protein